MERFKTILKSAFQQNALAITFKVGDTVTFTFEHSQIYFEQGGQVDNGYIEKLFKALLPKKMSELQNGKMTTGVLEVINIGQIMMIAAPHEPMQLKLFLPKGQHLFDKDWHNLNQQAQSVTPNPPKINKSEFSNTASKAAIVPPHFPPDLTRTPLEYTMSGAAAATPDANIFLPPKDLSPVELVQNGPQLDPMMPPPPPPPTPVGPKRSGEQHQPNISKPFPMPLINPATTPIDHLIIETKDGQFPSNIWQPPAQPSIAQNHMIDMPLDSSPSQNTQHMMPITDQDKNKLNVMLNQNLRDKLQFFAQQKGLSIEQTIELILEQHFTDHENHKQRLQRLELELSDLKKKIA